MSALAAIKFALYGLMLICLFMIALRWAPPMFDGGHYFGFCFVLFLLWIVWSVAK